MRWKMTLTSELVFNYRLLWRIKQEIKVWNAVLYHITVCKYLNVFRAHHVQWEGGAGRLPEWWNASRIHIWTWYCDIILHYSHLTCLAHWPRSGCSRRRSAGTRRRSGRARSSKSGPPWTSCSRVWSYCDAKSSGNMIQALQNETSSRHIKIGFTMQMQRVCTVHCIAISQDGM